MLANVVMLYSTKLTGQLHDSLYAFGGASSPIHKHTHTHTHILPQQKATLFLLRSNIQKQLTLRLLSRFGQALRLSTATVLSCSSARDAMCPIRTICGGWKHLAGKGWQLQSGWGGQKLLPAEDLPVPHLYPSVQGCIRTADNHRRRGVSPSGPPPPLRPPPLLLPMFEVDRCRTVHYVRLLIFSLMLAMAPSVPLSALGGPWWRNRNF